MNQRYYLTIIFVFGLLSLKAQYLPKIPSDSLLNSQLQTIGELTDSILFNPEGFVIGKFYYPRGTRENHPFFIDDYWKSGSVEYQGKSYSIPMMKYDLEKDGVVILKMVGNMGFPILLDKRSIPQFTIEGHRFVNFNETKSSGYHEELWNSHTKVWAKWTVWEKIDPNSNLKIPRFMSEVRFIILKNKVFYDVNNLSELYSLYSDRKRDLIKFKRENNLSFRNDGSGTVKKLTEAYDNFNK